MAKNLKETLLSTLEHGPKVLEEIEVLKRVEQDKIKDYNLADHVVSKLHKPLRLRINEIIDTGKHAKIIRFNSIDGYLPPFEAGQYINIFVHIAGVLTSRPYSLSSRPSERAYYEITVANIKDGFVSEYLCQQAKVGDEFKATSPAGVFVYQRVFHKNKALYLAGGSGITPFLSMIRENLSTNKDRDMVLLYGAATEDVALYHDELSKLAAEYDNFSYHFIASDPAPGYSGETGFMTEELIARIVPDFAERTSYICGPLVMNIFVRAALENLGLPRKQIRSEMFGAKKDITREVGWPSDVAADQEFTCTLDGKSFKVRANESLLTSLERNQVEVNVQCRSGECSLCRFRLVSGNVYVGQGALMRKADEKFGYIHSCKAYPISDIEIRL